MVTRNVSDFFRSYKEVVDLLTENEVPYRITSITLTEVNITLNTLSFIKAMSVTDYESYKYLIGDLESEEDDTLELIVSKTLNDNIVSRILTDEFRQNISEGIADIVVVKIARTVIVLDVQTKDSKFISVTEIDNELFGNLSNIIDADTIKYNIALNTCDAIVHIKANEKANSILRDINLEHTDGIFKYVNGALCNHGILEIELNKYIGEIVKLEYTIDIRDIDDLTINYLFLLIEQAYLLNKGYPTVGEVELNVSISDAVGDMLDTVCCGSITVNDIMEHENTLTIVYESYSKKYVLSTDISDLTDGVDKDMMCKAIIYAKEVHMSNDTSDSLDANYPLGKYTSILTEGFKEISEAMDKYTPVSIIEATIIDNVLYARFMSDVSGSYFTLTSDVSDIHDVHDELKKVYPDSNDLRDRINNIHNTLVDTYLRPKLKKEDNKPHELLSVFFKKLDSNEDTRVIYDIYGDVDSNVKIKVKSGIISGIEYFGELTNMQIEQLHDILMNNLNTHYIYDMLQLFRTLEGDIKLVTKTIDRMGVTTYEL